MNIFDLSAQSFLLLYATVLAGAVAAGLAIPRWLRPEGRARLVSDEEELALLAGGRTRFSDAIVARLLARRDLTAQGRDRLVIETCGGGRTSAESAVLGAIGPFKLAAVDRVLRPHAADVERRLVAGGAMIDGSLALQMRAWQSSPYLLLLVIGLIRLELGIERERPVGFLALLLLATLVLMVIRFAALDRSTAGGRDALRRAREEAERLRRAPTADEAGRAVALFGTGVLAGSTLGVLHDMRRAGDGSSSDGGCGGGGCGGCGS